MRQLEVRVELVQLVHERVCVIVAEVEQLRLAISSSPVYKLTFCLVIMAACDLSCPRVTVSVGSSSSASRGMPSRAPPGPSTLIDRGRGMARMGGRAEFCHMRVPLSVASPAGVLCVLLGVLLMNVGAHHQPSFRRCRSSM